MADESGGVWSAASEQFSAHGVGVEQCGLLHDGRMSAGDGLMAQVRVEVVVDSCFERVEVNVDEESVAASLDAGERHWKQVGQGRPVEPSLADSRWYKRQAERQHWIDVFVELSRFHFLRLKQLLPLGLPPQMPKTDLLGWRVVELTHQRRNGRAYLNADRIVRCRKDAWVRRAIRRDLAGLEFVAVQAVNPYRVKCLQIAFPHSRMRQPVEPRVVGNEAHYALAGLGNASLGHAEKADVEVVQPLPFRATHPLGRAIGF